MNGFRRLYRLRAHVGRAYDVRAMNLNRRHAHGAPTSESIDLSKYPPGRIRNFCIIAHVDHGKSTLADRLLEITGIISSDCKNEQVLDRLQVERERGITVKAQSAAMLYSHALSGATYLLNLIDTPGHVDFHYEVERSLSACQGVILLVDANEGVQAQTLANFYLAFEAELAIIPVLNKIDLKGAQPDEVQAQLESLFGISPSEVLRISAKNGTGVRAVLDAVVERVPPPQVDISKPLRALLFDSSFDQYRGAIANVAVHDGSVSRGDKILSCHFQKRFEVQEVGVFRPHEVATKTLYAGQVGYVIANMKSTSDAVIGDTFCSPDYPSEPLKSFKQAKPMVFAGFFPIDQSEHGHLKSAIEKLTLNDSSVQVNSDSSAALGQGWRLGFLGLLHMDVFKQRLEQEYNAQVIITAPNVPFKVKIHGTRNIKFHGSEQLTVLNPCHLPDESIITEFEEPMVLGTIIFPEQYLSDIISLCMAYRGTQKEQFYIDSKRIMTKVVFPLSEIVVNFFDDLKATTSGYASFDYEDAGYQVTNLVKLTIHLNGKEVEELTSVVHHTRAQPLGKRICQKLEQTIPRQLFEVAIQAVANGRVIARETLKAMRKNVLAKCYGGDITRKMKLLQRQAEGKEKLRKIGNVEVPRDAFISVLRK